jgi:hypothetical protein
MYGSHGPSTNTRVLKKMSRAPHWFCFAILRGLTCGLKAAKAGTTVPHTKGSGAVFNPSNDFQAVPTKPSCRSYSAYSFQSFASFGIDRASYRVWREITRIAAQPMSGTTDT